MADGRELGRGPAVMPGVDQELAVTLSVPPGESPLVRHHLAAGSVFAIGFPVGVVPDEVRAAREGELRSLIVSGATGDDLEAARGNAALWSYFWHVDREVPRLLGYHWMRMGRTVSEAVAGRRLVSDQLFGTPVALRRGSFVIDVPAAGWNPYSVDRVRSSEAAGMLLSLYHASAWEHLVWEETVHTPAISTVRVLQAARQQGLAILNVDSTNVSMVDGLSYSDATKQDVRDGVHAGRIARLPERPVAWGRYTHAEGYALEDPVTGSAAMRLGGLYSGGESDDFAPANGQECPCGPDAPASSTVSLSNGAMRFSVADLTVPARGIPVALTRHYDSGSPYGGRLGPGWMHSYEVRLLEQPGGDVILVNDAFKAPRFAKNADGSYARPPGYHEQLAAVPGGWTLSFRDGVDYRFRTDGQLAEIHDLSGHTVTLEYDAGGKLERVRDATGRVTLTFAYEPGGLLQSVTDVFNRTVTFGHEGGDLTSVTDVLGEVERYGYDAAHRMATKTDKNGSTTHEMYDGEGRWIGSREPDGNGRSVAYDWLNRRAVHVDKTGATTIWEFDGQGNASAVTDPLGNRRTMEWDLDHNKLAETDARGNRTSMTYDSSGNMLTRTDPLNSTTTYTYDAGGRVLTVTADAQHVTVNTYDASGRLETTTDPAQNVTRYGYTSDGLPETITQPGGAVTRLAYEADGKVRSVTDAEGNATTLGYDANGHLETITDALSGVRRLTADAAGRIRSMTDAANVATAFEYDAAGNRTAVVDAAGNRTTFGYDALGRLETVTDAKGGVSRTEYDAEGRVTARVDARSQRTEYRYDVAGRLVATTDAAGNEATQAYCADVSSQACGVVDALGNFTEVRFDELARPTTVVDANGKASTTHYDALGRRDWSEDAAGRRTLYGYDLAGRLETVTDPLGGVTRYGYDGRGNRTSVTDANGKVTVFGYDKANRLTSETNPLGTVTTYEYDAAGNRRYKTDGNGQRTEYQYDSNRRLRKVLFADGTSQDFDYDARGNRTLERSPNHLRTVAYDELGRPRLVTDHTLGRTLTLDYDAAGNRERLTLDTGEAVQYRWDGSGRLLEVTDPEGQATTFGYDAAGRRKGATYGNGTAASWAYDAAGQVLAIAYQGRDGGVQTAFGYEYDAAGNRKHKAFADGSRELYGYDALNRLTSAEYPGGRRVEYGYDGVGNRTWLADTAKAATTRWATTATASSSGPYGTPNALGPPDSSSWGSNGLTAWLEVGFGGAERATALRVHETGAAPFVMRVDLQDEGGAWHTVYSGGDTTANGGWLTIPLGITAYRVAKAKLFAQGTAGYAGVSVDAVGLDVVGERYGYNGFNQLLTVEGVDGKLTSFGYDGNGNQVSKRERTGFVTQATSYGYDQDNRLRTVAVPVGPPAEAVEQWGATATASSAYGTGTAGWAPSQATGAPNVAGCVSSGQSWLASSTTPGQWLEVGYASPAKAVGVRIHETGNAGLVSKVELIDEGGTAHQVWAGTDGTTCGQWLEVKFPETAYRVAKVKVTTQGQTHVDAVSLVSEPAPGPTSTVAYEYDANGLRTKKSDAAGVTSYLLDGLSVIAEYSAPGARQAWYTQSLARIDEVLNVTNSNGKFWYQADALGSIYALTTAVGDVRARGGYDVFGAPVAVSGTPVGQPFGFTGREHEPQSGLVYARDRHAAPPIGRWTQADRYRPNGELALSDLYQFVSNQPSQLVDPSGRVPFLAFVAAVLILASLRNDEDGFDDESPAWEVGWLLAPLPIVPIAFKCLKLAIRAPLIREITRAAQLLNRNGFTFAGRALQKHGARVGSVFPRLTGNPSVFNAEAEKIVGQILKNPDSKVFRYTHRIYGQIVEVWAPNGMGLRFGSRGFMGFLDP